VREEKKKIPSIHATKKKKRGTCRLCCPAFRVFPLERGEGKSINLIRRANWEERKWKERDFLSIIKKKNTSWMPIGERGREDSDFTAGKGSEEKEEKKKKGEEDSPANPALTAKRSERGESILRAAHQEWREKKKKGGTFPKDSQKKRERNNLLDGIIVREKREELRRKEGNKKMPNIASLFYDRRPTRKKGEREKESRARATPAKATKLSEGKREKEGK